MEIERTIKYSDGGMATGLVGEDQVKDLSFKIRVKEMPKSDTISLHEVVTIEPFDLGDEKNIVFSPFHIIFGDSSLAIFDALGVDDVAGLKRNDCVDFLENLKKQGKTERDGSFIAGLCNFSGKNIFMFFNVQRLNFKGFASRVLPHEALHLARLLITLKENKWIKDNLTTPEWYLDPKATFIDMKDDNEEFFAETLERTSAIAMDAWQRITGEKCYMDGGGIEDETKEVSDEHINSIIEDISDYKIDGSAEGDVDAETINFYGDYNEEDKNYNIEIVFKVDDPYADYEYVTDDPDETEKMVLPSYHLQSIVLIEDDMYNIQLTESQKEKISEAIESQFNNKIAAAYDYAMKMDAYESQDETGRMEMPRKYFMKDGGGINDVKSFVANKEGIIEIYSGSDARSAEVKIGDTFIVTEEMKNGIYYLGKLNIKGSFKLSAGLSGKDVNKMNFGKQDEILYLLRKENIGGDSNFFAQFKNNNKMKNGGDIHDLYQIIIYNRFGDEMHSYIIGDYEKAMENLKEDLKLAETGSRVDISHNGKVIYSETKKQYKNGGSVYDDYAENVSSQEIEGFIDYFMEAYNILSSYEIYSKDEDDIGEREEEIIETERGMIRRAILEYFDELQERREENYTWGGGDTLDRERVKIFYDGYFKRYKNGGGFGDKPNEDQIALYYITDYKGKVWNISKTEEQANETLNKFRKSPNFDGGYIKYAIVNKKDYESEKINVSNIKNYRADQPYYMTQQEMDYATKKSTEWENKKQNESLYKNGGGVGNQKTYRVPISKKISQQDVDAFVKYAQSFYGENNKVNNMYGKVSDEEVKKAAYQYIYDLSKLPTWSKDSMDRERVSQYLTKEIKSIFDLMHLYESNDGIKGDDYYYVVDFEKIPQSDVDWFINYVYSFYGRGGVRGSNPYTREQIEKAVYNYLSDLEQFPSWGDGDSIDRERVGQYLEGTTIFTGMYSYKNGGGVGDEMFSNELYDQYEESYVPIDLEKEIILPNGVTALWIEDNNGKVNIWKKGFGDLASAESWRKITKEKLLDEAVKEYDVKNERLRTTGKTYKTSRSTYAKGGGVGKVRMKLQDEGGFDEYLEEINFDFNKNKIEFEDEDIIIVSKEIADEFENDGVAYVLMGNQFYKKGGGVGMAMEGMFLDDDFERMVEKLKNYLAKYPYIWTRGTKRYVPIEGWQYAAALMGLSSRVKNVNEIQPGVWQAEADVVEKRSGVVNCSGFAIVNKAEHKWAKKDEDIINFVQTRAVSRALRNCISYLIKAAGYSSTPAEEMYGLASEEKKKKGMPSSIKPVKGVSEDDFIFDRPEYNEGMTQPPFPKEDMPITKYVPREEIPQEDMLRKVWAESKANGIVIRSIEFMNEIELALTDETIGTETQIKSLLMESYNWLTENEIVLRSKIFMKKFKDSL